MPSSPPRVMFVALCLSVAACGVFGWPGDRGVSKRIASQIEKGPGTIFNMADVADFEWTRFCAFPPYTLEGDTEAALGFDWPKGLAPSQSQDSVVDMVFVDQDRIVARFTYPISEGDFTRYDPDDWCHNRDQATFIVEDRGAWSNGRRHLGVVPMP